MSMTCRRRDIITHLADATELEHGERVDVVGRHKLEVLDGGLRHAPREVEHVRAHLRDHM